MREAAEAAVCGTFLDNAFIEGQQGLIVCICEVAVTEEQLCRQAPSSRPASKQMPQMPWLAIMRPHTNVHACTPNQTP